MPGYPATSIEIDKGRLFFGNDRKNSVENPVWDKLWNQRWPGRIAVACAANPERVAKLKQNFTIELDDKPFRPRHWTEQWRQWLHENLYFNAAMMQLPGDYRPALDVPGFVHGNSQGICDIFGTKIQRLPDGNYYVHPLPSEAKAVSDLQPSHIEKSLYWNAIEYIRYARAVTNFCLPFRNPVMTGPLDTANYLLGTTTLLEWLHTEPETVHLLLRKIRDVLIKMMRAIFDAAESAVCSHHLRCMQGGLDVCSEMRSLISPEMYDEFEAPYLYEIGQSVGPYSAHSCGNWERTVPSIKKDPCFRAMNGQVMENNLERLCCLAAGKISLSIGRSVDVHECFTWPDTKSYYRYVLETVPPDQPLELTIEKEEDILLWESLHQETLNKKFEWSEPHFKSHC